MRLKKFFKHDFLKGGHHKQSLLDKKVNTSLVEVFAERRPGAGHQFSLLRSEIHDYEWCYWILNKCCSAGWEYKWTMTVRRWRTQILISRHWWPKWLYVKRSFCRWFLPVSVLSQCSSAGCCVQAWSVANSLSSSIFSVFRWPGLKWGGACGACNEKVLLLEQQ